MAKLFTALISVNAHWLQYRFCMAVQLARPVILANLVHISQSRFCRAVQPSTFSVVRAELLEQSRLVSNELLVRYKLVSLLLFFKVSEVSLLPHA